MAAHRFWRVWFDQTQGGRNISVAELQFRETPGGANWANALNTTTSSRFDVNHDEQFMYDGLTTTRWSSADSTPSAMNQWILVDAGVGVTRDLAEIVMTSRAEVGNVDQHAKEFRVEWSDNGWLFFRDWTVDSIPVWTAGITRSWVRPARSNQPSWRIYGIQTAAPFNMGLTEVELRTSYGGPQTATGGTAFASSFFSAAQSPDKAFDGNAATVWATVAGDVNPAWIGYRYPAPVTIVETMLKARTDAVPDQAPQRFSLDCSPNDVEAGGARWAVVAEWWNVIWTTLGQTIVASVPLDTVITEAKLGTGILSGADRAIQVAKVGDAGLIGGVDTRIAIGKDATEFLTGAWPDRLAVGKDATGFLAGAWPDRIAVGKIATQFLLVPVPRAINGPVQIIGG